AFAAPAGYVFVTRGLLKQIRNEAELAAVLGHEIAHVSQKHILEVIQRSKSLAGVSEAGLAYAHQNPDVFKNLIDAAANKLLEDPQLRTTGAAGSVIPALEFLLRHGKYRTAQFANAELEHRLAIVKAGRQEQVGRVVPRYHTVLELHDRQPDVELLPGGSLS